MTQKTLAERVGANAQVIMRLEQGIGSVNTLNAAMDALEFRLIGIGPGSTLSEQLRNRRMKRSLSLDRLSQRTGLSRPTLAGLERGGGSVASLMKVLKILAPNAKRRAPERAYTRMPRVWLAYTSRPDTLLNHASAREGHERGRSRFSKASATKLLRISASPMSRLITIQTIFTIILVSNARRTRDS